MEGGPGGGAPDNPLHHPHPLRAGTDVFPYPLLEKYLLPYLERVGIPREEFLALGLDPENPGAGFNMTAFAIRVSGATNAVSARHAEVAGRIWAGVRSDGEPVKIRGITNGVHLPTWIEPLRVQRLLDRYLGPAWRERPDDPAVWEKVLEIPDEELWRVHEERKGAMLAEIASRARRRWAEGSAGAAWAVVSGAFLDPRVLTLGFARRFTGYKRPTLLLHDRDRLARILTDPLRPVQVVFAGKAHPADHEGKRLLQEVYRAALDPRFGGRIALVEEYDQHLAKYLVAGVDVWLNTPFPPRGERHQRDEGLRERGPGALNPRRLVARGVHRGKRVGLWGRRGPGRPHRRRRGGPVPAPRGGDRPPLLQPGI